MLNDRGFKVEVLASAQPSQEIVLGISEGMKCGGCASRAQRLLAETEGVESAEVSFEDKTAAVQVDALAAVAPLFVSLGMCC